MIGAVVWFLLLPVTMVTLVLLTELGLGLAPHDAKRIEGDAGSIAIVVPALDEARHIAAMLAPLQTTMPPLRVLVVADNCSDATAEVARGTGVEVIERHDPSRRGKGFALAYARDHLAIDPPDIVIAIDADCAIDAVSIGMLARRAAQSGRPVQAAYLMRPRRDRGVMVALSGFAFLVKNLIRQRGLARLGAPAILTGSGMAFPWAIFAQAPLATDEPVEDLSLGIALSRSGTPPLFLDSAIVWSEVADRAATQAQRGRWERGFLATASRQAPGLIGSGRASLVWLGLHLTVPPLALLAMLHIGLLALTLALPVPEVVWLAEVALTIGLLLMLGWLWFRHGRGWLSVSMLAAIPLYMIWKLPIYGAALLRRQRRWNRTGRS